MDQCKGSKDDIRGSGCKKRIPYRTALLLASLALNLIPYAQGFRLRIRPDDFGPLIYPAALAGYDWRTYVASTNNYYGFGYYWIFAPLFRFIRSPHGLLMAMVLVNTLLISCSALLIWHLLVRYCGRKPGWGTALFSLVPVLYHGKLPQTGAFWVRTDNETPFYLALWLFVWLMLAAWEAGEETRKPRGTWLRLSAGAALLLCWAMTVHERAAALLLAAVLLELVLLLLWRRQLFAPLMFFGTLAAGFAAQRLLRNAVIRYFWMGGWPGKNTSAFSRAGLWFLKSRVSLKSFCIVLLGNLRTLLVCGLGIPALGAAIALLWLGASLRRRRKEAKQKRREPVSGISRRGAAGEPAPELLMLLLGGIGAMIVTGGIAMRWGGALSEGIASGEVVYAYKGICYNRYFFLFLGPILLGTMARIGNTAAAARMEALLAWGLFGLIEGAYRLLVYPYCVKGGDTYLKRTLGPYFTLTKAGGNGQALVFSFVLALLVLALLTVSLAFGQTAAHRQALLWMSAALVIGIFGISRGQQVSRNGFSLRFYQGEEPYAVLTALEEADALPQQIFIPKSKQSHVLRYMNREIALSPGMPSGDTLQQDNLILCTKERSKLKKTYRGWKVGSYWFYTNNANAQTVLEEIARR